MTVLENIEKLGFLKHKIEVVDFITDRQRELQKLVTKAMDEGDLSKLSALQGEVNANLRVIAKLSKMKFVSLSAEQLASNVVPIQRRA